MTTYTILIGSESSYKRRPRLPRSYPELRNGWRRLYTLGVF